MSEPIPLLSLNPRWVSQGGEGVTLLDGTPVPRREGIGLIFDCPCGCASRCHVPFSNPIDGGPDASGRPDGGWLRAGDTFETLRLSPSILRSHPGSCGWHGFIGLKAPGEVTSC